MAIRFGAALKELRIHLCQTSANSAGVRAFLEKYYVPLKQENPNFPILVRECNGVQPRVWARYDRGVEQSASLVDLTAEDVATTIKKLANQNQVQKQAQYA